MANGVTFLAIAGIQLARDLAAVVDLGDGVAGQHRGVRQVELSQFSQAGNGAAGVGRADGVVADIESLVLQVS